MSSKKKITSSEAYIGLFKPYDLVSHYLHGNGTVNCVKERSGDLLVEVLFADNLVCKSGEWILSTSAENYRGYPNHLANLNKKLESNSADKIKHLEEKQGMKKSDLKTGMIVEIRNGRTMKVLLGTSRGDILTSLNTITWASVDSYRKDLTHQVDSQFDIIRIYQGTCHDLMDEGILLWDAATDRDKPQVVEVTMSEVCEKFGKQVKIIEG